MKCKNRENEHMNTAIAMDTTTEDEAIQAVIDRTALRIPTTNSVVYAGRIMTVPAFTQRNTVMIARFQVENEDLFHPTQIEVAMQGPAAEFCRQLHVGQAIMVTGYLASRRLAHGCHLSYIAAIFIEPLQ